MKITIDSSARALTTEEGDHVISIDLYSKKAFEILSEHWLRVGWNQKYQHTFTWMGRPVIQLPEDMVRLQEVIYRIRPDVIIETGIAHGGSLVFYAGLCKILGQGRVVGIDIEIRPHNRAAIEAHEMFPYITLIEGSSIDPVVIQQVRSQVKQNEKVLILLDSNHSKDHVLAELEAYHPLVSIGSFIVATDGFMESLSDVPRGNPEWKHDNPASAAIEFANTHPEFVIEQPLWHFNESELSKNITHWPSAWLRRHSK
jgi:cephalosporin hydroxylase